MPSPIAHGLAGLAIVHVAYRRRWIQPSRLFWLVALLVAVNAADVDFLPGLLVGDPDRYHHGPTHSVVAALAFGVMAAGLALIARVASPWRAGALLAIFYASHLLLDALSIDTSPTGGMIVWWPFSPAVIAPPVDVFLDIQHDESNPNFLLSLVMWHNAKAFAREVIVMGGLWMAYRVLAALVRMITSSTDAEPRRSVEP